MSNIKFFCTAKHFADTSERKAALSISHEIRKQFFCFFPEAGVQTILKDCESVLNTLSLGTDIGWHGKGFLADTDSRYRYIGELEVDSIYRLVDISVELHSRIICHVSVRGTHIMSPIRKLSRRVV